MSTNKAPDHLRSELDTRARQSQRRSLLAEYLYELILATAALAVITLVLLLMRLQG